MAAQPYPMDVALREEHEDGSLRVRVRLRRSKWQRWFGAPAEYERQYTLDPFGREVYAACDGETNVEAIAAAFAERHQLNPAEAQRAVTTYLKTLMSKSLIGMKLDREVLAATTPS